MPEFRNLALNYFFAVCISLLMFCPKNCPAQSAAEIQRSVDRLVYGELNVDMNRTPGFIVGIIAGDSTYTFAYGTTRKDTTLLPTPTNLFEIGSLTNIFTARLINILCEEKVLDKTVSINNYLPDSLRNSEAQDITLAHLLTHTSGLPRVPLGIGKTQSEDNQPYAFYTKEMLGVYYRDFDFAEAKKGKYRFSHLGYALLELIIEEQTGRDFAEVLAEKLPFPATKINLQAIDYQKLVSGHDKSHQATPPQRYAAFASAVGLKSDLNDLLLLLRQNIDGTDYDSMQKQHSPTEMRKNTFVGEGWHIIRKSKRKPPIVLHTGATSGYRAYMAFVKEARTGVVVLSNSEYALRGLGYFILEELR